MTANTRPASLWLLHGVVLGDGAATDRAGTGVVLGPIPLGCVVLGSVVTLAACSSDGEPAPTAATYLAALESVCAGTATALDALPDPPDGISVTDFATQASALLRDEAESIRALAAPDELDDDHRALIRNDEEQAAAWSDLAAAAGQAGRRRRIARRADDDDRRTQPRARRPRGRDGRASVRPRSRLTPLPTTGARVEAPVGAIRRPLASGRP